MAGPAGLGATALKLYVLHAVLPCAWLVPLSHMYTVYTHDVCRSCSESLLQRLGVPGWYHTTTIRWLFGSKLTICYTWHAMIHTLSCCCRLNLHLLLVNSHLLLVSSHLLLVNPHLLLVSPHLLLASPHLLLANLHLMLVSLHLYCLLAFTSCLFSPHLLLVSPHLLLVYPSPTAC